ncbi:MAG: DUF2894 domain-containing protein [Janthinobacterium lividum]
MQALCRRSAAHHGNSRRFLDARLALTLAEFEQRFTAARDAAAQGLVAGAARHSHAAAALQHCFDQGDFGGLQRLLKKLEDSATNSPLAALVRRLEQHADEQSPPAATATDQPFAAMAAMPGSGRSTAANNPASGSRGSTTMPPSPSAALAPGGMRAGGLGELKTLRQFRNTWAKLSADKQVAQALVQAPKNAGPVNSHMLVLRSLELMREISPDYLNRFISYADALLCLDGVDKEKPAAARKAKVGKPVLKK